MRLLLDMINWSFYNKSLVRRGEVILDFDVIDVGIASWTDTTTTVIQNTIAW